MLVIVAFNSLSILTDPPGIAVRIEND